MKSSSSQKKKCTKFVRKGHESVTRRRVKRHLITKGKLKKTFRKSGTIPQTGESERGKEREGKERAKTKVLPCDALPHARPAIAANLQVCVFVFFFQTFSIFRMSSSASSFWDVMMHDTHKLASTIAGTPSKLSEAFFTMGS